LINKSKGLNLLIVLLGGALRSSAEELQPEDHPTDRHPAPGKGRIRAQQEPDLS